MTEVSDLSEVVDDGVLSEPYKIERTTGQFQAGGFVESFEIVGGYGVVSVASEQDLIMIPEGDRVTGAMVFHSKSRIYETQKDADGTQYVSDVMIWNYQRYRVLHVGPYPNRKFWKAIAVRMQGN